MATRFAHSAPVGSGLSLEHLGGVARKVVAYIRLLAETFAEAREQARIAHARWRFIEE